jgi:hypothetical protein
MDKSKKSSCRLYYLKEQYSTLQQQAYHDRRLNFASKSQMLTTTPSCISIAVGPVVMSTARWTRAWRCLYAVWACGTGVYVVPWMVKRVGWILPMDRPSAHRTLAVPREPINFGNGIGFSPGKTIDTYPRHTTW